MSNPTTLAVEFDGDAGAFTVSGPEVYDDGLVLASEKINLIANPSVETNLDGYTNVGGGSSRSADWAIDGTYSIKTTGVDQAWRYFDIPVSPSTQYVFSFYAVSLSGWSGELAYGWRPYDAGGSPLASESYGVTNAVLTPTPQRLSVAFTTPALTATVQVLAWAYGGPDRTWYADAMLDEPGSTPTVYGAAASASFASIATTGILTPASGSLALRLTRNVDTGAEELYVACGTVGSGTDALRGGVDSSDHPFVEWNSDNAGWERLTAVETIAAATEFVYLADWTGTVIQLQIDGGTIHAGTRDTPEGDWGAGDLILEAA